MEHFPECGAGESWLPYNIEGFLDKLVRNMMCRNGSFEFLVKHHDSRWSLGSLLTSDLQGSVQKVLNRGCDVDDIVLLDWS